MTILSKDNIINADDLKTETLEVEEWGGTVRLQQLTADDRDLYEDFRDKLRKKDGSLESVKGLRAYAVSLALIDESGSKLFNGDGVEALGKKSDDSIDRVFAKVDEMNGLTVRQIEETEKNSAAGPTNSSG